MVYVLNKEKVPLMSCSSAIGRILVKQGKAKVKTSVPFTIVLKYETTNYIQDLTLGVDTGSVKIGTAVTDEKKQVLYLSEVELRKDITEKMKRRSKYRRNRRNRNTRYRKERYLNRKNSIKNDRFSPTMISKFNAHHKEIKFIKSILPIKTIILETGTFDPHALKNPEILTNTLLYQQGINYGYANTRAYILHRDDYKCQNKSCKSKNNKLEVHHIIYRQNGGSDEQENLITLCKDCHDGIHDKTLNLKLIGKKKGTLKYATQMNSIRIQLLKRFPEAIETFGYITKEHRQSMNLPKEHCFDAVAITSCGDKVLFKTNNILLKKCVSDGDYQLKKGVRSEMIIPVRKIMGFRKFDKVKYDGKKYFIKGRQSAGYAFLMNIKGEKINLKPIPKLSKLKRITTRKSWLVDTKKIIFKN